MKKHSISIIIALILTMTFVTVTSCGGSKGDSPAELKLDHRKILQNHFKDEFVNVDNTSDIDEKIIIIDSIKEGIFKLEVEDGEQYLTKLEAGSLIDLEESLKELTAKPLLKNTTKAQAWYLLGRLYDLMVYDVEFNQKSAEAFDRCEKLEQNNPDRLELFGRIYLSDDAKEAIDHFSRAIKYIEDKEAENNNYKPQLIRLYRYLGTAYYNNNEYDKALEYLKQGLGIADGYYKKPQIVQVEYYNWLATVYIKQDKLSDALNMVLLSEKMLNKIPQNSYYRNYLYFTMANIYKNKHDSKAENYYLKAIDVTKQYYGDQNSNLILDYNNLATYYKDSSKYDKALFFYNEALLIINNTYQENSKKHANQFILIANTYKLLEQYENTENFYNKALKASIDSNGYYSETTSVIYNNYASTLSDIGLYQRAIDYIDKSLEISIKLYHSDHLKLVSQYNNLAINLYMIDDFQEAKDNFKRVIDIYRVNNMDKSLKIAKAYRDISFSLLELEEYQEAYNYSLLAYELFLNKYGESHSLTISAKEIIDSSKAELE